MSSSGPCARHDDVWAYGRNEVRLHSFLPATLQAVLSASCCGRFTVVPTEQKAGCTPESAWTHWRKYSYAPPTFVGCGPPKSCASVCSSNIQHAALIGVTTKVVFFWDLALKIEAAGV